MRISAAPPGAASCEFLSAESVVGGSIGRVGQTYSLTLKLVDVETRELVKTSSQLWTGTIDQAFQKLQVAAEELAE